MPITRRTMLKSLGLAATLPLAGCGWNDSSWNQKLTVTVETPHGEVSGSAVQYVAWSENQIFKDGARWQLDFKGEAVVVDMGAGKYLFATLASGRGPKGSPEDIGRVGPNSIGLSEGDGNTFRSHSGPIAIKPEYYPMLVAFGDLNDPKSVKEVKPDNLAATFGSGYALKSITLEITDEKVTEGKVRAVIPWILEFKDRALDGETVMFGGSRYTLANFLGMGSFDANDRGE